MGLLSSSPLLGFLLTMAPGSQSIYLRSALGGVGPGEICNEQPFVEEWPPHSVLKHPNRLR